ncbi:MAG: hypothetical protein BWY76_03263 [bacterium ADurb.Bin429]|nr:MAG: hypothetical protein BWY76_03263 [bacterium ADurb.Bin429]
MDGVAGGAEVFALQHRAQVIHEFQLHQFTENSGNAVASGHVPGIDHRQAVAFPQPRARVGRAQRLRQIQQVLGSAAVSAAGHENHVRTNAADALYALVLSPAVIYRQHVNDDGARAQRRPLRALRRHVLHHPGHQHLQAAASAAGGQVDIHPVLVRRAGQRRLPPSREGAAGQIFQFVQRVQHAYGHVVEGRFHGGGRLAARDQPIRFPIAFNEDRLRRRAAAIGGNNRLYWFGHRYPVSVSRLVDFRT